MTAPRNASAAAEDLRLIEAFVGDGLGGRAGPQPVVATAQCVKFCPQSARTNEDDRTKLAAKRKNSFTPPSREPHARLAQECPGGNVEWMKPEWTLA